MKNSIKVLIFRAISFKVKNFYLFFLLVVFNATKAQVTPSVSIPNPIPEYNGTYEDFGTNHFFYPNDNETRYANPERTNAFPEVAYYTKHTFPRQYLLNNNNISFVFAKRDSTTGSTSDSLHRIDLEMDRGNPSAFLARMDTQSTGILNYFDEWYGGTGRTDVRGGAMIACQSIYPDIDMVYTSNNAGLKIYYVVYPGGNPNQILLKFNGAKSTNISGNDLVINGNWSSIKFAEPKMYQYTYVNNVVTPVNVCPAYWQVAGTDIYQIATNSSWNSALPLIIQVSEGPSVQPSITTINWSTYFGGGNLDYFYCTKSDANNNLFVAGTTSSSDFPQAVGATPVQAINFNYDAFLSKFSPAGVLLWNTYFGGSGFEKIKDFDFKNGDVYTIGFTDSQNMPVFNKAGAFNDNSAVGGFCDGFIFQVDIATGGTNKWSTHFGGNGGDYLRGCKFDSNGNFFVVGGSNSSNLTPSGPGGSYQQSYNSTQQITAPGFGPDICDGIILKFNSSTSALDWFTFYGTDAGGATAHINFTDQFEDIDISGTNIFACGYSGGTNLPSSINSKVLSSSPDGMLVNFSTSGALTTAKYTASMLNRSVRVHNSKVYVCGQSRNGFTNVNSGNYFYDNTCANGDFDAYFSVHSLNLNTTIHNTFFGGTGIDGAYEMQFAPNGIFYMAGATNASDFPITSVISSFSSSHSGGTDNFIAAFQENNTICIWSTCIGTPNTETDQGTDDGVSISIDGQNFLHMGGSTNSNNAFPLNNNGGIPYFQSVRAGNPQNNIAFDGTITRFDLVPINIFVGLEDFKGTAFSFGLYPNPTTKYLVIDNSELANQNLNYVIYNSAGQKISDGKLNAQNLKEIDVSNLAEGIYFINVSNNKRTFCNKFIKTNE